MAASGESIYKWIAPVPVVPEKPPMYKSSAAVVAHSKELVASTIRVKHAKHVMGSISTREEPLMAHSKDKTLDPYSLPAPFKYPSSNVPPVPRRHERPLSLPASGKSFVQQNAVDAIMAPRRAREKPAPVDWLKAPSFGKVPGYLAGVKQELEQERDLMVQMIDAQQMESESASGGHTREMADDERAELIEALKRKWDTVNDKYQVISHRNISTSNSTKGEIRWKETCEQQMAQLEKDILRLSSHGPVYIVE